MSFDFIVFFAFLSLLLFHEFGHYIIAWKFGWKPKLKLVLWKKFMPSMAVYTEVKAEIRNEKEFLNLYSKLTAFASMGLLIPLIMIIFFVNIGIFNLQVSFITSLIFTLYSIFEISFPCVKLETKENKK